LVDAPRLSDAAAGAFSPDRQVDIVF
jgi:hypothetical protein